MADPALYASLERAEKQNEKLSAQIDALQAKVKDLNGALDTALKTADARAAEVAALKNDLALASQNTQLKLSDERMKGAQTVKNLETQIDNLKAQIATLSDARKNAPRAVDNEVALRQRDEQIAELARVSNALREEVRREKDLNADKLALIATEQENRRRLQAKLDTAVSENHAAKAAVERTAQVQIDNLRKQLQDAHAARMQADDLRAQQARNHSATNNAHDKQLASLKTQVEKLDREVKGAQNLLETERVATRTARQAVEDVRQSYAGRDETLNKRWAAAQAEKQEALAKTDGMKRHVASLLTKISDLEVQLRAAQDLASRARNTTLSGDTTKLGDTQKELERKSQQVRDVQAEYDDYKRNAVDQDRKRMETIAQERKATVNERRRADDAEARLSQLESDRALA